LGRFYFYTASLFRLFYFIAINHLTIIRNQEYCSFNTRTALVLLLAFAASYMEKFSFLFEIKRAVT